MTFVEANVEAKTTWMWIYSALEGIICLGPLTHAKRSGVSYAW